MEQDQIDYIDDIEINKVNYSDGCGFMSLKLALKIAAKFGLIFVNFSHFGAGLLFKTLNHFVEQPELSRSCNNSA